MNLQTSEIPSLSPRRDVHELLYHAGPCICIEGKRVGEEGEPAVICVYQAGAMREFAKEEVRRILDHLQEEAELQTEQIGGDWKFTKEMHPVEGGGQTYMHFEVQGDKL